MVFTTRNCWIVGWLARVTAETVGVVAHWAGCGVSGDANVPLVELTWKQYCCPGCKLPAVNALLDAGWEPSSSGDPVGVEVMPDTSLKTWTAVAA